MTVRIVAALLFVAPLLLLWPTAGPGSARLWISVSDRAVAGRPLPVRVHLLRDSDNAMAPVPHVAKVRIALHSAEGQMWSEADLQPGLDGSFEGALDVPSAILAAGVGELSVVAEARSSAGVLARAAVSVQPREPEAIAAGHGLGERLVARPRPLRSMQQTRVGSLRPQANVPALDFSVHVRGGACTPEVACRVLVACPQTLGASQGIAVSESPSVEVVSSALVSRTPVLLDSTVRVHGPEAHTELRLTTGEPEGQAAATAALQLPVALGWQALQTMGDRGEPGMTGAWALGGPAGGGCIVDLFLDGNLLSSTTQRRCERRVARPKLELTRGSPVRVQIRRDPYGSDASAVRIEYMPDGRGASHGRRAAVGALARAAKFAAPGDPALQRLAARWLERDMVSSTSSSSSDPPDSEAWAAFFSAVLEARLIDTPPLRAGGQTGSGSGSSSVALVWAVAAVFAGGVALLTTIGRGAAAAAADAAALMAAAGQTPADLRRASTRRLLRLLTALLSLAVAFVAIAAYLWLRF